MVVTGKRRCRCCAFSYSVFLLDLLGVRLAMEKKCTKCGEVKSVSGFDRNKNTKDGFAFQCKNCMQLGARQYRADNREKLLLRTAHYRTKHREAIRQRQRQYRADNRDELNLRQRQLYSENPEKFRLSSAANHAKHKEKRHLSAAKYRANNRETIRAKKAIYQEENREKINLYRRQHRALNKESYRTKEAYRSLTLSDSYIKRRLTQYSILTAKEIPYELVELKRLHLIAIRLLKEVHHEHRIA